MQKLLPLGLCLYCLAYAFEGALRYGLDIVGRSDLIFTRDLVILIPVAIVGVQQFLARKLNPAYLVYIAVVLLHGIVFVANFKLIAPAVLGAKLLATILAGAIACKYIMNPKREMVIFFAFLWASAVIGIYIDKFGIVSFPWVGMSTTIGDIVVDVSRDWTVDQGSPAYRAGGFMRSSIHAANLIPLLAFLLVSCCRSWALRIMLITVTVFSLYWTTQKGSLLAFVVVSLFTILSGRFLAISIRSVFLLFLAIMMILPIALPGYHMPVESLGGFSNDSFNLRVEMMWPEAWRWIDRVEAFPFGVGLGGIGGAQQLYAMRSINAADNMFVFMYAYFGVMSVLYLGGVLWVYLRTPIEKPADRLALFILLFVVMYGWVLSMLEDQMTALFIGAALGWVAYERNKFLEKQADNSLSSFYIVKKEV